jgi:hypothetical protein
MPNIFKIQKFYFDFKGTDFLLIEVGGAIAFIINRL